MNDRDLTRVTEVWMDTLRDTITTRVQSALALERDRHDEAIAELRDEIVTLANRLAGLERVTDHDRGRFLKELHSVRVDP